MFVCASDFQKDTQESVNRAYLLEMWFVSGAGCGRNFLSSLNVKLSQECTVTL